MRRTDLMDVDSGPLLCQSTSGTGVVQVDVR